MIAILLALVTAVVFGLADFFSGSAGRRAPLLVVMLLSQSAQIVLTLTLVIFNWWIADTSGLCVGACGRRDLANCSFLSNH